MWTTDNSIKHRNAIHTVLLEKFKDLLVDCPILAHVGRVGKPPAQLGRLFLFRDDDADGDFRGKSVVRAVVGDRPNRIAGLAVGLFIDPVSGIVLRAQDYGGSFVPVR